MKKACLSSNVGDGLWEILQLYYLKFQTDKISIKMVFNNKKYISIYDVLQVFLIS